MKAALLSLALLSSVATAQHGGPNRLTALERAAGWELLFDGETFEGWRALRTGDAPGEGWQVVGGALYHTRGGGDLVSERAFGEFELEFEWRVAEGANSGVKYMVASGTADAAYGPEYQVLDDARHVDGALAKHRSASLYDLYAPEGGPEVLPGVWHRGRIVVRGDRIEHWLDGARVVDVDTSTPEWRAALAASKYAGTEAFARTGRGHLALQDHGDEVWYRSLRVRELPVRPLDTFEQDLFGAPELGDWFAYGDAIYERADRTILGKVGGGGQSFLLSGWAFEDFVLEVDVKTERPGNSGIQVRCHQRDNGRPFGYQIEIDPSDRAWTGGLYDEARRGWLDDLSDDPAGRAAFRYGEWNRFRIECVGPWIRASVNGVPTADTYDLLDLSGVLGLQVHSGNNTCVRWRNPRVWNLGAHHWRATELIARAHEILGIEVGQDGERWTITSTGDAASFPLPVSDGIEVSGQALRGELLCDAGLTVTCGEHVVELAAPERADAWRSFGVLRDGTCLVVFLEDRIVARVEGTAPFEPVQLRLDAHQHVELRGLELLEDR
ncbi:MAG: DUF1080 domain-containing protein [Planctomycetes bacterium]|nr:DUF1080 domain-containing protein [Planctomycetota bacterium]